MTQLSEAQLTVCLMLIHILYCKLASIVMQAVTSIPMFTIATASLAWRANQSINLALGRPAVLVLSNTTNGSPVTSSS